MSYIEREKELDLAERIDWSGESGVSALVVGETKGARGMLGVGNSWRLAV